MKQYLSINWKWLLTTVPVLLTVALILGSRSVPAVDAASPAIASQEVSLDAAYFAQNGQASGLTATAAGLTLTPGQDSGVYESGVIETPLAFTTDIAPLWQADLPAGTTMRLETRLSLADDVWSDWVENPEAYYPVRNDEYSGNLIWVGSGQAALQVRVTLSRGQADQAPTLRALALVFSDTSAGPTSAALASRMAAMSTAAAVCPPARPAVVSRTDWGNPDGQNSPRRPPTYALVSHIVLHQAETPNTLSPYQDWASWVRSIWNYHANVLRWGDVGYNFMIDPNGVIYEGRAGGDDVVGIHDTINRGSMSLGFLGCYGNCDDPRLTVVQPNPDMLKSAEALLAWKVGQKGLNPLGSGPYGRHSSVPVIAGGRDVIGTTSPGDNLYAALPALRQAVAEKNSCTPLPTDTCQIQDVIFDKSQYQVGDPIKVTVRLTDKQGTPLGGAKVTGEVVKDFVISQADTGFNLIDRSGDYDGLYQNTSLAGSYRFLIRASDPTGSRFLPCTGEKSVTVGGAVTPTPVTPTPVTPTPVTPTPPPPTVTPVPGNSTITFDPANRVITSGEQAAQDVIVKNVSNLTAVSVELSFDPAVVQAVGEVTPGAKFGSGQGLVVRKEINNATGRIFFDAVLLAPNSIDGNGTLFSVTWGTVTVGTANLKFEKVTLLAGGSEPINPTSEAGTVQVTTSASQVSGQIALQGRQNHGGITVVGRSGQTQTDPAGKFSLAGSDSLTFSFPGYLSGQAGPGISQSSAGSASLGQLILLAGDVNGDDIINILDLAYLASKYQTNDSLADLNGDGRVNILDLALAAQNYDRKGPLKVWQ